MFKNMKLNNKLKFAFLFVALISTLIVTVFSIFYFSDKIQIEAQENMRKNLQVADLIYNNKVTEVKNFTTLLSNDKPIQTYLSNNIITKLNEYLSIIVKREKVYNIAILDSKGDPVVDLYMSKSKLTKFKTDVLLYRNTILSNAMKGKQRTATELIPSTSGKDNILSISSASPIIKNEKVIGVVFVRFILNDDKTIVRGIKDLLGVDAFIYQSSEAISYTSEQEIRPDIYQKLMGTKEDTPPTYESIDISIDGELSQYKTIFGIDNNSIGVLGISISAEKYAMTRISAIITLLIIMLVCVGGAYVLGMILSRSIVSPIKKLLEGVKKISSGDLTYEIKHTSNDEIGVLSAAFDDMRIYLNEMITTIEKANGELEKVNQGLESEVRKRTEKIESLLNKLKKYLSPQLYDSILGGTRDTSVTVHSRKKLTIFFSDIVSFTSTTESMEAEDLSDLLNNYLDNMAKIALKWGGTIDKFIGDAVMVFFGDPEFINDKEHSLRAVKMSLEMMERMKELREEWKDRGIEKPLHIRVGINTGYCTVGNFGSENRMDYTIIGGNVNLASRLETSAEPDTIHISYETYSLIKDEIDCLPVGELTLKGINHPVKTYKVIGSKSVESRKETMKHIRINEKGGLIIKNITIDPDKTELNQAEEIIKSLKIALACAQGKIKYIFDENIGEWKLIKVVDSNLD